MANWKTSGKFRMKIKQQKKHGFASRVMRKAGPILRPNDLWENKNRSTSRSRSTAPFQQDQSQHNRRLDPQSRYYGRYVIRGLHKRPTRDPTSSFYQRTEPPQKRRAALPDPTSIRGHNDQREGSNQRLPDESNLTSTGMIKPLSGVRRELTYSPRVLGHARPTSIRRHHTIRKVPPRIARRRLARPCQHHLGTDPTNFGTSFTTRPPSQTHEKPFIQPSAAHGSSLNSNHFLPSDPRSTIGRQYNHQSSGPMPYSEYDTNLDLEKQQQQPREWQHPHQQEYYPAVENYRSVVPISDHNGICDGSGQAQSFQEQQQQSFSPYEHFPMGDNNHETEFPFSDHDPACYTDFSELPLSSSPWHHNQQQQQQQQQQENFPTADYGLTNDPYGDRKLLSQPIFDGADGIFGSQAGTGRQCHNEQEMYPPEDNRITNNDKLYEGYTFFDPEPEENMHDNFGSQQPHFHHEGEQKAFSQSTTGFGTVRDNNNGNVRGDNLELEQENVANVFEDNFDQVGTDENNSNVNYNGNRLEDDQYQLNDGSWNVKGSADAPSAFLKTENLGVCVGHENNIYSEPLFGNNQSQKNETGFEDIFLGNKNYPEDIGESLPKPPNLYPYDHCNDNIVCPNDCTHTSKPFVKKMSEITVKPDIDDQISSLTPTSFY